MSESTPTRTRIDVPREGMLATIRNPRGLVTAVDAHEGLVQLVTIEYTDADGVSEDQIIWEREVRASLQEPSALPRVQEEAAMPVAHFDALVRAARQVEQSVHEWADCERHARNLLGADGYARLLAELARDESGAVAPPAPMASPARTAQRRLFPGEPSLFGDRTEDPL